MLKKLTICLLALCCSSATLWASTGLGFVGGTNIDSHLGIGVHAGLGGFGVNGTTDATANYGVNYGLDISYLGGFSNRFGFVIGASLRYMNCGLRAGTVTSEYIGTISLVGNGDSPAIYKGYTSNVEETYTTMLLSVPVMLSYNVEDFFLMGGVKFAMPVNLEANYKCGDTKVYLTGVSTTGSSFDDGLNQPLETNSFSGFSGSYDPYAESGKMRGLLLLVSLEVGYRIQFYRGGSLQFSIFGDYSLNDLSLDNTSDGSVLSLGNDNVAYRGLLNAGTTTGLSYLCYGLRVQYNISIGRAPKSGRVVRIL